MKSSKAYSPIDTNTTYRGDVYSITTIEMAHAAAIQLRVLNTTTNFIKYMKFSHSVVVSNKTLLIQYAGQMITSVWMRKYTPVDTKIGVATSEIIEALLC